MAISILAPLKERNYLLFFLGQAISLPGSWFTTTAIMWLVYTKTNSESMSGLAAFLSQAPNLLVMPMMGVMLDRMNRYYLLVATEIGCLISSVLLFLYAHFWSEAFYLLLILCVIRGAVGAMEVPARQSLVITFLNQKRELLSKGIGINSVLFNLSRVVGPSLAGYVMACDATGSLCFGLDAASYIPVVILLLMMRVPNLQHVNFEEINFSKEEQIIKSGIKNVFSQLHEGVKETWKHPQISRLIGTVVVVSFFGASTMVLLPMMAKTLYGGGANLMGNFMAASALGATTSAFLLTSRKSIYGVLPMVKIGVIIMSLSQFLLAFLPSIEWVYVALFLNGSGGIMSIASSNTLVQAMAPEHMRGRMISLFAALFSGMMPIGQFALGAISEHLSLPLGLTLAGTFCLFGGMLMLRKVRLPKSLT